MGCYDVFLKNRKDENDYGIQLKAGPCLMYNYQVGDKVDEEFADGAYISYEGVVIIEKGIVAAIAYKVFNKWGGEIDPSEFLDKDSPFVKAMDEVKKEIENLEV